MSKSKSSEETPLMKQYHQIKAKHPGALLLFRVGDFYETFGEDAIKTSQILGIVLTKRKNGAAADIELAGFPHHSLETYLPRLVRAGQRVAVCDQLEDPKMTKAIVKRGVTELVTPGVAFNDHVLSQKSNNFLAAIHVAKSAMGIAFLDVSTGEFYIGQGDKIRIEKLLAAFSPVEVVFQKQQLEMIHSLNLPTNNLFRLEDWVFNEDFAHEQLISHFGTKSLSGFGVEDNTLGIISASAALFYVKENQVKSLDHVRSVSRIDDDDYVWLDRFTIRNLELIHPQNETGRSLLDVIDFTLSPMGGRLLKRWLIMPLTNKDLIEKRNQIVAWFQASGTSREKMRSLLAHCGDLERLISKVAVGKVNPREIQHIRRTLDLVHPMLDILHEGKQCKAIEELLGEFSLCQALVDQIKNTLMDDPAVALGKGFIIREGVDPELDELRNISENGKKYLLDLQERESERTGISSLKISFNNVFGYYIEVRNTHKDKVPEEWTRRQTLVNAERYITEELKAYEEKIITAESRINEIEHRLFLELLLVLSKEVRVIQKNASAIAKLDVLCGLSVLAVEQNYCKPEINLGFGLHIEDGRHPVIETTLKPGEIYVPNDLFLSNEEQQIMVITGPNMSGKSAVLRQTALIVILAQMGSFVPAKKATIGIIDKVFTRVGASDNLSSGESTFMVEMNETASILNNLSDRSLVILDEIGRGTSTFDGISIAWSITEYLHEQAPFKAKTLFATHYHELNEMATKFSRIKNFSVAVKEIGKNILFIRKLIEGGSEHSFGIHVARIAGMPPWVIRRSEFLLKNLESSHLSLDKSPKSKQKVQAEESPMQLSFFQLNDPVLEQIHETLVSIDINVLTPVEAFMKLHEIKKLIGG